MDSFSSVETAEAHSTWIRDCMAIPNTQLHASTKGVIIGLSGEYLAQGLHHAQELQVCYPDIAKRTGLSVTTVLRRIAKLAKDGVITQRTITVACDPTKEKKRCTFIAFTHAFLANPYAVYGGVRKERVPFDDEEDSYH